MFHVFAYLPDGTAKTLEEVPALKELLAAEPEARVWVDVDDPAEQEMRDLQVLFDLADDPVDDCLRGEQRPRIDEYEDYLFLVFYGLVGEEEPEELSPRKLTAFCGRRFLITVHQEPIRSIARLRERFLRHAPQLIAPGVDALLYAIVDAMVDNYLLVAERFEDRVDALEERSLGDDMDETLLTDAADLRRDLLKLRHLAEAGRDLVLPLVEDGYEFVSETLRQRFQHVQDHLLQTIDAINLQRELLTAVRENYDAALAQRTNAAMKAVAIYAGLMLPLTVIAGIYGMNFPVWPPGDDPLSFWAVLAAMGLIAAGLVLHFRRRKWL